MKESLRILLLVGMVIAIGLLPGKPAECDNGPSITKQVDKTSASPGDTLTYTISYSNPTANTYTNIRIEDSIPNGTTYIDNSATGGATFDGSKIIVNIGNLSPGASGSVQFQVRVINAVSLLSFGDAGHGGDDTAVFQRALDSVAGQSLTLLVPASASPCLVKPLFVRSSTSLQFAPGVVIQAAPGYGDYDCLLNINGATDVTISGYGATLQMPKQEYTEGEHRHALNINGSTNVVIQGLNCNSSGGDGIYISGLSFFDPSLKPYSENIVIQDVTCDNNRRNGLSIISAQNLLVSHCNFTNTNGTDPQDGIDIEPNWSTDWLVNIRIEDCVTANNVGNGIQVILSNMNGASQPVSVTISRHVDQRSGQNGYRITGAGEANPVTGAVTFASVTTQSPQREGVRICCEGSVVLTLSDLTITNPDQAGSPSYIAGVFIDQPKGANGKGGNVSIPTSAMSDSTGKMKYYFHVWDDLGLGFQHLQIAHGTWSGASYDPYGSYCGARMTSVDVP